MLTNFLLAEPLVAAASYRVSVFLGDAAIFVIGSDLLVLLIGICEV
ncbi:hypothetical protein [Peribacillus muralis]|nr:hypothetical protein [Peribacillus muralis]